MGLYKVTVYFETGINSVDILASPAVLSTARNTVYPDFYYKREDVDAPSIVIKDNYDNLRDVDYVRIDKYNGGTVKESLYYFAIPHSLAGNTTLMSLKLDGLMTLGGAANLNYTSGWQSRGHIKKEDDTLFNNMAAEDFSPSQELKIYNTTNLKGTGVGTDVTPVITSINLTKLSDNKANEASVIKGIVDGSEDAVMYLPQLTYPAVETYYNCYDFNDKSYHKYKIAATAAYESTGDTTKSGIAKLYSFGQLQIQSSYVIPGEWVGGINSEGASSLPDGVYGGLYGIHTEKALSSIPYQFTVNDYTIKNKKTYSLYRTLSIMNLGSGDLTTRKPSELYNGGTAPSVQLWSDMTATGKPYARFAYIAGTTNQYAGCVQGLQWNNNQLVMEGASGSFWNSISNGFSKQTLERNQERENYELQKAIDKTSANMKLGAVGAIGNAAISLASGDLAGFASNTVGVVGDAALNAFGVRSEMSFLGKGIREMQDEMKESEWQSSAQAQARNENSLSLLQSNSVVAPSVSFSPVQNLGLYGYNYFIAYETRMQDDDVKALDKYFQRYGYNGLHRPLTKECFNQRQYYSFVQAFDINIKSSFGKRIREAAIAQLNSGVRVWNVLPDSKYYEVN